MAGLLALLGATASPRHGIELATALQPQHNRRVRAWRERLHDEPAPHAAAVAHPQGEVTYHTAAHAVAQLDQLHIGEFYNATATKARHAAKAAELRRSAQTAQAKEAASASPDAITFVHVGKTGGSTLRDYFREHNIDHQMVHTAPGDTYKWRSGMLMRGRCVVVSVRDPVARTISAFNWRHPDGGVRSTDMNNLPGGEVEDKLYKCFPELPGGVSRFAEALNESTACGNIARRALHEEVGHLGRGLRFYFGSMYSQLAGAGWAGSRGVFLVHAESLDQDVTAMSKWLCRKPSRSPAEELAGASTAAAAAATAATAATSSMGGLVAAEGGAAATAAGAAVAGKHRRKEGARHAQQLYDEAAMAAVQAYDARAIGGAAAAPVMAQTAAAAPVFLPHEKANYPREKDTQISEKGLAALRWHLADEYYLMEALARAETRDRACCDESGAHTSATGQRGFDMSINGGPAREEVF